MTSPKIHKTAEEVIRVYEEWMKLAADNKINATNSWNCGLIDYFADMAVLKEGDSINFQKASCTLDGCVKIYTTRVESVAAETERLLSGLNQSEPQENKEEEEVKKVEKRKKTTKTLEKDFTTITREIELEFMVDPLFRKTSAQFDEAGAKGLLFNHLQVQDKGQLLFDSTDICVEMEDEDIEIDFKFEPTTNTICPSLETYVFNDQPQNYEEIMANMKLHLLDEEEELMIQENEEQDYVDIVPNMDEGFQSNEEPVVTPEKERFDCIPLPRPTPAAKIQRTPRKKQVKEPIIIDFTTADEVDIRELFEQGPQNLTQKSTLKHLIEEDDFDVEVMNMIKLNPTFRLHIDKPKTPEPEEVDEEWVFDAPLEDEEDHTIPEQQSQLFPEPQSQQTQMEIRRPPRMDIARSKQVDVKKLKENIWDKVTKNQEIKFNEVLSTLKQDYSTNQIKDISNPFCFICILHLANEKNLRLEQQDGELKVFRE